MKVLHRPTTEKMQLSPATSAVFKVLAYYDVFKYPLTLPEIEKYATFRFHQLSEVEEALGFLKERLIIFQFGEFYSLRNEFCLITRRTSGNLAAFNIYKKAQKRAALIHQFPFVRSVNISGSLSKNYYDESTDIDFFVMTKPGRLWLCRLLLTLYKKVFLFNSRKYFCINYYVDTDHLEIPDKNLFSATEIVTLRNMSGAAYYRQFITANTWVNNYFPNHVENFPSALAAKDGMVKKAVELFLGGNFGSFLDTRAQGLTRKFIRKKYNHISPEHAEVNLRTHKSVSKHHPQGFQFKVLNEFDTICNAMEEKHSVILL
ncbi:MAG: hypothetical protein V9F05_17940 [Chitinophagaceae bacterium]|jgi:hypothetical protein|nr:nucleotidyltransferase domain-containing protein [Bacteroidota bacterium]MBL0280867.1 nucleotidyltransferase domain-containing protein [Bacteroidota bacterium]MBP9880289.1 hypothetical protein [Chitinophagales bacterium]